jgi:predicted nucleic acid-binding protein
MSLFLLLFGGTPGKLICLWQSDVIKPVASQEIVDEYIRVLTYPKFKLSEEEINYLLYQEILPFFEIIDTIENVRVRVRLERAKVLSGALKRHPGVLVFPGWELPNEAAEAR